MTPKPASRYATVETWRKGLTEQWGEEPADFTDRVALLERFCAAVDRDPDTLIDECCREVESGKRIRVVAALKGVPALLNQLMNFSVHRSEDSAPN